MIPRSLRTGWRRPPARGAWPLLLALVLGACSTEFDPYADGPPYFALDAVIDTRDDTLFVRVQDLTVPPGAPVVPLDSRVTLTDLTTGTTSTLRDSIAELDGGGLGHLFWTTSPVQGGRTYRLQAVREDDPEAVSEAVIAIPPPAIIDTTAVTSSSRRIDIQGPLAGNAPIVVRYEVRRADTGATATITSTYFRVNTGAFTIVSLSGDASRIRDVLSLRENEDGAVVTRATISYLVASPTPIPVTDGLGRITWTAFLTAEWRVPAAALQRVGLEDGQSG